MVLLIFMFVFVLGPIARAYAKRLDRPLPPGASPPEVARLREELDLLGARVERMDEEQRFLLRLLSDDKRLHLRGPAEEPPATPEPPER